jgi:hypothetical protein
MNGERKEKINLLIPDYFIIVIPNTVAKTVM